MNGCPCNECLMIPVCRHKSWSNLTYDCRLINEYSINYQSLASRIFYYRQMIQKAIKPTKWSVDEKGWFNNESTL